MNKRIFSSMIITLMTASGAAMAAPAKNFEDLRGGGIQAPPRNQVPMIPTPSPVSRPPLLNAQPSPNGGLRIEPNTQRPVRPYFDLDQKPGAPAPTPHISGAGATFEKKF